MKIAVTGWAALFPDALAQAGSSFLNCREGHAGPEERSQTLAFAALERMPRQSKNTGTIVTVSKGMIASLESGGGLSIRQPGADAVSRRIAKDFQFSGPSSAAVAACASGLASVKLGMDWLRDDVCENVLAGAAESSASALVLRSFERLGVLSSTGATRPFDKNRDGFVSGEGCAIFSLAKSTENPLVWIRSIALASDAYHLTTPDPGGEAVACAIETALQRAEISRESVGWIHAHGTGTELNDAAEIAALRRVFKKIPPVTATKGATGHLLGASGAVALAITIEALRKKEIPPTAGLREPDSDFRDVDFVMHHPRECREDTALVLNYGFGGHIAVCVVSCAR